ncbi:cardiolipin synthase [Oceanicella actignis]|uniref:Cardiolipin synthase n=1 Tax=Oceanicella actignis TaxID=1189325 RepID=A0A1M7SNF0_9RHOB|nr:cardiolipin synthase [Oceanicella actignis]SES64522.1 cardiolipin synthase [Oceanicella actignis]SHN60017.1 cardiolipin synthase [Oceanicella actignis]
MSETALALLGLALLWGAAGLCAISAVRTARTPQGAVGWVLFLILAPVPAVPAYMVLGRRRMSGYARLRRAARRHVDEESARQAGPRAALWRDPRRAGDHAAAFERLAGMPVTYGNAWRILRDGEETFAAMFRAIEDAREVVLAAFYTIEDDEIGRAFRDLLARKARQGVRVHLLYDAIGSSGLGAGYLAELRAAGVRFADFNALHPLPTRWQINFRNHRKIVVTDGRVGFLGGLNVSDAYLGRRPPLSPWRDTHLELRGPAAAQLQLVFAEDWAWATGETLELDWRAAPDPDGADALILPAGPADPLDTGSLYFCNAIEAARERVWLATPYFVPDEAVLSALQLAALRGVDVRIIAPANPDHWLPWLAAFAFFDEARAAGVRILRWREGFMHQKVAVVDESFASIGSINLDNRSCRLNFEVTAILFDADAARAAARMLEQDMARCMPFDQGLASMPAWVRAGAPLARLLAPML